MINVLIIGYGYWGPKLARNFSNSNNFNLHSICDLNSNNLKIAKKNYPNVKLYSNFKEALKLNKYDLVVISTPTSTHYKLAKIILSKGINVLVEKPLCFNLKEQMNLNKIAKYNKNKLFVDYPFVHAGSVKYVKKLILNNKYGKLISIESYREQAPVRKDTNVFWDLSIHDISIFNYLLNNKKINSIKKIYPDKKIKNYKKISIFLKYGNTNVFIKNSWNSPTKIRLIKFIFEKATIYLDENETLYKIKIYKKLNDQFNNYSLEVPNIDLTEPLMNLINHIHDCINKNKKNLLSEIFYTNITKTMVKINNAR